MIRNDSISIFYPRRNFFDFFFCYICKKSKLAFARVTQRFLWYINSDLSNINIVYGEDHDSKKEENASLIGNLASICVNAAMRNCVIARKSPSVH
jgi:hypothetical protein